MNNSSLVEIFTNLKNPKKFGLLMGEVTADLPEIKIDIGDGIVLDKDDLLFSAGILKDYEREYKIESTDAQLKGDKLNASGNNASSSGINYNFVGAPFMLDANGTYGTVPILSVPVLATSWSLTATSFDQKAMDFDQNATDFKSTGKITLTDQIKTGDKVMIMATDSNQLFYIIDKVISF